MCVCGCEVRLIDLYKITLKRMGVEWVDLEMSVTKMTKGKGFQFCLSGSVDPKFRNTRFVSVTGVVYDYVKPLLGLL